MLFADKTNEAGQSFWNMLLSLIKLPALQSLSIDKIEAIRTPSFQPAHNPLPMPPSPLTSLELKDCVFSPAALHALLTFCTGLKSLKLSIPHHYANQYAQTHAMAPWDGLTEALEPVKQSLEILELDASQIWWHYQAIHTLHPLTQALLPISPLAHFPKLRIITLPHRALLRGSSETADVAGILPVNVEELVMVDDRCPSVENRLLYYLGWLERVLEEKEERFRRLRKVLVLGWKGECGDVDGELQVWRGMGRRVGVDVDVRCTVRRKGIGVGG
ncbi:hypothetical protein BU26DRAFT_565878 [Trematosphaeria pertusa]|uniref:F-box domain-containing protein n=1 Tax=Trematosphaeria pertusa TaxID=390896 RepID=A0A6A6IDH6_9PLEO|nr:uncharacterized protein BU26DRAFT_565878 [Trematosphaeria pertusa]KAF2248486.1 hypothetical protein BU26DRAFT_565878 [Trematosphaeria pertusa]